MDMAKALEDLMKPGVHAHVFCSAIQLAPWYEALASEKNNVQKGIREYSGVSYD